MTSSVRDCIHLDDTHTVTDFLTKVIYHLEFHTFVCLLRQLEIKTRLGSRAWERKKVAKKVGNVIRRKLIGVSFVKQNYFPTLRVRLKRPDRFDKYHDRKASKLQIHSDEIAKFSLTENYP